MTNLFILIEPSPQIEGHRHPSPRQFLGSGASGAGRGLHFFNPVPKMLLVEVATMAGAAQDATDRAVAPIGAIKPVLGGPEPPDRSGSFLNLTAWARPRGPGKKPSISMAMLKERHE